MKASFILSVCILCSTHLIMVQSDYSPEEIKNFIDCLGKDLEARFKPCMAATMKCFAPADSAVDEKCAKENCKETLDWKKVDTCSRQAHAKVKTASGK